MLREHQKQRQPPGNSQHLRLQEPEGRTGQVLTFPIVAGSDVAEGTLKNKGGTFAVADSPERLYFSLLILNDYSHENCANLKHDAYYKAYN